MRLDLRRKTEISGEVSPSGKVRVITECHTGWSTGWCARIVPRLDGAMETAREWLTPTTVAVSKALNGDKVYNLDDGFYEAESVYQTFTAHRTTFEVRDGAVTLVLPVLADACVLGTTVGEVDAQRNHVNRGRKEWAREAGLPPLIGTPSQTEWAERLRHEKLVPLLNLDLTAPEAVAGLQRLREERQARFWIDYRAFAPSTLLRMKAAQV